MDGHEDERYKIVFNSAVELGGKVSEFLHSITDSMEGKIIVRNVLDNGNCNKECSVFADH